MEALGVSPESPAPSGWPEANQRFLLAELAIVRLRLEGQAANETTPELEARLREAYVRLARERDAMPAPSSLDRIGSMFALSPFERQLLVLCAGLELESDFAGRCAAAQGDPQRPFPTFSLALAALEGPHWSALSPSGPLRHWRLIEVAGSGPLTTSPLRIDERILHYLAGVAAFDERLGEILQPLEGTIETVPSHGPLVNRIQTLWSQAPPDLAWPIVQLFGRDSESKRDIVRAACLPLGLTPWALSWDLIPTGPADLESFVRLWERELLLSGNVLLVELDAPSGDAAREAALLRILDTVRGPVAVSNPDSRSLGRRRVLPVEVRRPTRAEQGSVWREALRHAGASEDIDLDALTSDFDLSPGEIRSVCLGAAHSMSSGSEANTAPGANLESALWSLCRSQRRLHLQDLAIRIEPSATWEDLVVPPQQRELLREVAGQVRHRATVYDAWGFRRKSARGLGISALFVGPSGTGKTMAAEVLATELGLDLYRIDLSQVVSKYIGETEKNLRNVFNAAEDGGVILLFDEADALFGKRSEVKDSHDRYANIEISYLLQRMEAYRGLAILTTNMKEAVDTAFLRRIRFVIEFPFPDSAQREAIWNRIFPRETPTEGLDTARLARLNLPGGSIRNVALRAAFLAARSHEPVRMNHVLHAARNELERLGKPAADSDLGGGT